MALGRENRAPLANLNEQRCLYNKQRPLAPAILSRSNTNTPYKRPTNAYYLGTTLDSNNPAVVRRNARERNRVKQVNNGFSTLRQHIPSAVIADLSNGRRGIGPGANKKLSKVDTLRMAVEYIRRLKDVIDEVDRSDTSSVGSYSTCGSSESSSPPPTHNQTEHYTNMDLSCFQTPIQYSSYNYAGSFQSEGNNQMISPINSNSSAYSSPVAENHLHAAFGLSFEENSNTSADDEELLDYISLWQDDL